MTNQKAPVAAATAVGGQESSPDSHERPESMTTVTQAHADLLAKLMALFEVEVTLEPEEPAEKLQRMRLALASNVTDRIYAVTYTPQEGPGREAWQLDSADPTPSIGAAEALRSEGRVLLALVDDLARLNLAQVAQVIGVAQLTRVGREAGL